MTHNQSGDWRVTESLTILQIDGLVLLGQAIELRKRTGFVQRNDGVLDFSVIEDVKNGCSLTTDAVLARFDKDVRLKEAIGMYICASLALKEVPAFVIPRVVESDHLLWFANVLQASHLVSHVTKSLVKHQPFLSTLHTEFGKLFDPFDEADMFRLTERCSLLGYKQLYEYDAWVKARDLCFPFNDSH